MMKIFVLLISFVTLSFAQSVRVDDPHYVDLVPSKFTDTPTCKSNFDQSNPLKCQNRVEPCEYNVEVFTKVTPFRVKGSNPREHLFAQVDGFDYSERGMNRGDKTEFSTISAPANLKIYSIFRQFNLKEASRTFLSVSNIDLNHDKDILLEPKKEFQSVKFDFSKFNFDKKTPVYLFDHSVGDVLKNELIILDVAPGSYNLIFTFGNSKAKGRKSIVIDSANTSQDQVVVIEQDMNHQKLGYNGMVHHVSPPVDKSSVTRVLEKKSISHISQNKKLDITNYFDSSSDEFLRLVNDDAFIALLSSHSPSRMQIKGICKVSEFKPQLEVLPIFGDSDKKKKVGEFNISYDNGVSYQYSGSDGKKSAFVPNLYNGYCENSERYLGIQKIVDSKEILSDLGEGPWGKHGWIEIPSEKLFSSDFVFSVPKLGAIKLKPSDKFDVLKFDYYEGEGHSENEVREVKRDDLISPDGILNVKMDCETGC